jgi:hypothetical protein
MRRRLLLAVSVGLAAAASVALGAASAHAHAPVCVVAEPGARVFPFDSDRHHHCRSCCCRRPRGWPVRPDLAFRVEGQHGAYLHVRHGRNVGRIFYRHVRLAPDGFCRAAGM